MNEILNRIEAFIVQLFGNAPEWIGMVFAYIFVGITMVLLLCVALTMIAVPIILIRAIIREIKEKFY